MSLSSNDVFHAGLRGSRAVGDSGDDAIVGRWMRLFPYAQFVIFRWYV